MLDSYLTMILVFAIWSRRFHSASSVILNALHDSPELFQSIFPRLKSYLPIPKQNLINSHLSLKTKFKHLLTFKAYLRRINYSSFLDSQRSMDFPQPQSSCHVVIVTSVSVDVHSKLWAIVEYSVPTTPYNTSNRVDGLNE